MFAIEPPLGNGVNIANRFHIVEPKSDDPGIKSNVDSLYQNVAIITFDDTNQFGVSEDLPDIMNSMKLLKLSISFRSWRVLLLEKRITRLIDVLKWN